MDNDKLLSEEELEKVIVGLNLNMSNPISGITREQAEQIAKNLGTGKDNGSWRTMSAEQFMEWWEKSNGRKPE